MDISAFVGKYNIVEISCQWKQNPNNKISYSLVYDILLDKII